MSGRVNDKSDRSIVSERQQLLSAGVPGVPAAEGRGRLVREHDEILGVVEDCLGEVLLLPRGAGPRIRDQTPRCGKLPQFHERVLKLYL